MCCCLDFATNCILICSLTCIDNIVICSISNGINPRQACRQWCPPPFRPVLTGSHRHLASICLGTLITTVSCRGQVRLPGNAILFCQRHALCNSFNTGDNEEVAGDLHHIGQMWLFPDILHTTTRTCIICTYATQAYGPVLHKQDVHKVIQLWPPVECSSINMKTRDKCQLSTLG